MAPASRLRTLPALLLALLLAARTAAAAPSTTPAPAPEPQLQPAPPPANASARAGKSAMLVAGEAATTHEYVLRLPRVPRQLTVSVSVLHTSTSTSASPPFPFVATASRDVITGHSIRTRRINSAPPKPLGNASAAAPVVAEYAMTVVLRHAGFPGVGRFRVVAVADGRDVAVEDEARVYGLVVADATRDVLRSAAAAAAGRGRGVVVAHFARPHDPPSVVLRLVAFLPPHTAATMTDAQVAVEAAVPAEKLGRGASGDGDDGNAATDGVFLAPSGVRILDGHALAISPEPYLTAVRDARITISLPLRARSASRTPGAAEEEEKEAEEKEKAVAEKRQVGQGTTAVAPSSQQPPQKLETQLFVRLAGPNAPPFIPTQRVVVAAADGSIALNARNFPERPVELIAGVAGRRWRFDRSRSSMHRLAAQTIVLRAPSGTSPTAHVAADVGVVVRVRDARGIVVRAVVGDVVFGAADGDGDGGEPGMTTEPEMTGEPEMMAGPKMMEEPNASPTAAAGAPADDDDDEQLVAQSPGAEPQLAAINANSATATAGAGGGGVLLVLGIAAAALAAVAAIAALATALRRWRDSRAQRLHEDDERYEAFDADSRSSRGGSNAVVQIERDVYGRDSVRVPPPPRGVQRGTTLGEERFRDVGGEIDDDARRGGGIRGAGAGRFVGSMG